MAQKQEAFPLTCRTWIMVQLEEKGEEGRAAVIRLVMELYRWPLEVYFKGMWERSYFKDSEPSDIVNGFFAKWLEKPNYFSDWFVRGGRLRDWLKGGLCLYVRELWEADRRLEKGKKKFEEHARCRPAGGEESAARAMDRALAVELVRAALKESASACAQEGFSDHHEIFVQHFHHDRPYSEIAPEFNVTPGRAAVMARTAAKRFREAVLKSLERICPCNQSPEAELRTLLEVYDE